MVEPLGEAHEPLERDVNGDRSRESFRPGTEEQALLAAVASDADHEGRPAGGVEAGHQALPRPPAT